MSFWPKHTHNKPLQGDAPPASRLRAPELARSSALRADERGGGLRSAWLLGAKRRTTARMDRTRAATPTASPPVAADPPPRWAAPKDQFICLRGLTIRQRKEDKMKTERRLSDFDHPVVENKAAELTLGREAPLEKMASIFHFITTR